jgi:hypothetical protein
VNYAGETIRIEGEIQPEMKADIMVRADSNKGPIFEYETGTDSQGKFDIEIPTTSDMNYINLTVWTDIPGCTPIYTNEIIQLTQQTWDIAAVFNVTNFEYDNDELQIFGKTVKDGEIVYAQLDGTSDDTYTVSYRYCPYNGKYYYYPDAWDIERKSINENKYQIIVRGRSDADCGKGQPQNTGLIKINPNSGWKITEVNKCKVSSDTYDSNNVLIDTYCEVDKENGIIKWQSGSGCGGCCLCADGAIVEINVTLEKIENLTTYCTDSDGGKNYWVKGIVRDIEGNEYEDYCKTGSGMSSNQTSRGPVLNEFFCAENGYAGVSEHLCPYGCENGACIKKTENITISGYELVDISNTSECHETSWGTTICTYTLTLEYRKIGDNTGVFVHLMEIPEKEEFKEEIIKELSSIARYAKISKYDLLRIEDHKLAWFTKSDEYDFIITSEFSYETYENGVTYHYGFATGDNPVIYKFIQLYPIDTETMNYIFSEISRFRGNISIPTTTTIYSDIEKLSKTSEMLKGLKEKINNLKEKAQIITDYYINVDPTKSTCWNEVTMVFEGIEIKIDNVISEINDMINGEIEIDITKIKDEIREIKLDIIKTINKIIICATG